jgi:hypothetical protein
MRQACFRALWLVAVGLVLCGCESDASWQGRYASPAAEGAAVTLTLQADGKGLWMVDQESTPVRWKKRQGALWLHVRTGGVLIARPLEGEKALSVDLPGGGNILLKKVLD